MDSKTSAEKSSDPGTKAGKMRRPEQGNLLWQMYHRLTRGDQRELKDEVQQAGFYWTTFLLDSKLNRPLHIIPFYRLDLYRSFLMLRNQPDVFELARKEERTTEKAAA